MGYERFEDLPVWKSAIDLALRMYGFTKSSALREFPGLRDQLERAAQSVSNNIAEGFERGTHEELIAFLYIALGSAGEVRSMTYVLEGLPELREVISEIQSFRSLSKSISRQLAAWLESLKNSPERGPRHRNDRTRGIAEQRKRGEEFMKELRRVQEGGTYTSTRTETSPLDDKTV